MYSRLVKIANREYIRGKKGKNQALPGCTSCLATWSNKKIPCGYHPKRMVITTRFRANGGAHVKNHIFTSQARIPARCRRAPSQRTYHPRLCQYTDEVFEFSRR